MVGMVACYTMRKYHCNFGMVDCILHRSRPLQRETKYYMCGLLKSVL